MFTKIKSGFYFTFIPNDKADKLLFFIFSGLMKKSLQITLPINWVIAGAFCFFFWSVKAQVITEICPSNQSNYEDNSAGFPDWIEIHNPTGQSINLDGFSLTDNILQPFKWPFPDTTLLADSYLVFSAYETASEPYNINFSFGRKGGTVYLFSNQNVLVDSIHYPELQPNHSYGKLNGRYYFYDNPSPSESNENATGYKAYTSPPLISIIVSGGQYFFKLKSLDEQCSIYYSLNGTNPISSHQYTGLIPVMKNTTVKAICIKDSSLQSKPAYKTIFLNADHHLPIVNLSLDSMALFGEIDGIYMKGPDADPEPPFDGANYWEDTEIEVHYDYYDTNLVLRESVDCALKIHGGRGSRMRSMKPLQLLTHNYHETKWFKHPYFLNKSTIWHSKLILRNSGNDFEKTMMKDGVLHDFVSEHNFQLDVLGYHPVVVYINGNYHGIHNIREKFGKQYLESIYNINPDSVNILENKFLKIIEGSDTGFVELKDYVLEHDMANLSHYSWVEQHLDIPSLIDYYIIELFVNNRDWPKNNIKLWNSPEYPKWRYVCFDLDVSLTYFWNTDYPDRDYLRYLLDEKSESNPHIGILKQLFNNPEFKRNFINRYADLLNTVFKYDYLENYFQIKKDFLAFDMVRHFKKWKNWDISKWHKYTLHLSQFFDGRADFVQEELAHTFDTPDAVDLSVNIYPKSSGTIALNTLQLNQFPFNGKYYPTVDIELYAQAINGHHFLYWENLRNSEKIYQPGIRINPKQADYFVAVFSPTPDPFELHVFPNPAVDILTLDFSVPESENVSIKLYDLSGRLALHLENYYQKGVHQERLSIDHLESGSYILSISSSDEMSSTYIIRQ